MMGKHYFCEDHSYGGNLPCPGCMRTQTFWPIVPNIITTHQSTDILYKLKSLDRFEIGEGDDGDGRTYDYEDKSDDGRWVKWGDIEKIIKESKGD